MNMISLAPVLLVAAFISGNAVADTSVDEQQQSSALPPQNEQSSSEQQNSEDAWSDENWSSDDSWGDDAWAESDSESGSLSIPKVRFMELGIGQRFSDDVTRDSQFTLRELRTRFEWQQDWEQFSVEAKFDVVANGVTKKFEVDVRELAIQTQIAEQTDLRVGKQVLSWGVGDYIFLNDLFPKNWQAFFNGRDDEYLKAAANAVQVSHYFNEGNVQFVWFPRFTPDEFINGQYFSYFNPIFGQQSSERMLADRAHNDEFAFRLFKRFGVVEAAFYGHWGQEKTPRSMSFIEEGEDGELIAQPFFAAMNTYGASVSSPAWGGIVKAEVSYGESQDDKQGINPLISNSIFKALAGFETELAPKLTGSWQAYIEDEQDFAAMQQTWPTGIRLTSRHRVMFTQLYRYQLMQDTLSLNLLHMHSTSDKDGYVRINAAYKFSDNWHLVAGGNMFYGEFEDSFFGQFEDAQNIYFRLRHYW